MAEHQHPNVTATTTAKATATTGSINKQPAAIMKQLLFPAYTDSGSNNGAFFVDDDDDETMHNNNNDNVDDNDNNKVNKNKDTTTAAATSPPVSAKVSDPASSSHNNNCHKFGVDTSFGGVVVAGATRMVDDSFDNDDDSDNDDDNVTRRSVVSSEATTTVRDNTASAVAFTAFLNSNSKNNNNKNKNNKKLSSSLSSSESTTTTARATTAAAAAATRIRSEDEEKEMKKDENDAVGDGDNNTGQDTNNDSSHHQQQQHQQEQSVTGTTGGSDQQQRPTLPNIDKSSTLSSSSSSSRPRPPPSSLNDDSIVDTNINGSDVLQQAEQDKEGTKSISTCEPSTYPAPNRGEIEKLHIPDKKETSSKPQQLEQPPPPSDSDDNNNNKNKKKQDEILEEIVDPWSSSSMQSSLQSPQQQQQLEQQPLFEKEMERYNRHFLTNNNQHQQISNTNQKANMLNDSMASSSAAVSDVLSTASVMGTVINLRSLDDMVVGDFIDEDNDEQEEQQQHHEQVLLDKEEIIPPKIDTAEGQKARPSCSTPKIRNHHSHSSSSPEQERSNHQQEKQQKQQPIIVDVERLSLPSLDVNARNNNNNNNGRVIGGGDVEKMLFKSLAANEEDGDDNNNNGGGGGDAATNNKSSDSNSSKAPSNKLYDHDYVYDEKKLPDNNDNNREQQQQQGTTKPTTTSILSNAIRRIGSGIGSGLATARSSSFSAPNTPLKQKQAAPTSSPSHHQYAAWSATTTATTSPQRGGEQQTAPSSFLLRSPGSSARVAAKKRYASSNDRVRLNHPRLAAKASSGQQQALSIPENHETGTTSTTRTLPPLSPPRIPTSSSNSNSLVVPQSPNNPLVLARACFSFDAYDTSMDDQYEYEVPMLNHPYNQQLQLAGQSNNNKSPFSSPSRHHNINSNSNNYSSPTGDRNIRVISRAAGGGGAATHQQQPSTSEDVWASQHSRTQPLFRGRSSSWDTTANASTAATTSAFRYTHSRHNNMVMPPYVPDDVDSNPNDRSQVSGAASSAFRTSTTHFYRPNNHSSHNTNAAYNTNEGGDGADLTSPPRTKKRSTIQEWSSPQTRMEMEREDALDILALLVGRGVSTVVEDGDDDKDEDKDAIDDDKKDNADPLNKKADNKDFETEGSHQISLLDRRSDEVSTSTSSSSTAAAAAANPLDVAEAVKQLEELSRGTAATATLDGDDAKAHHTRVRALQELLRSHEYAVEMRRVSQSASSWLESIGRSPGNANHQSGRRRRRRRKQKQDLSSSLQVQVGEEHEQPTTEKAAASDTTSETMMMDVLTARATVNALRAEVNEKSELADRLNAELSKCREEIGRLRSRPGAGNPVLQRHHHFRSPNRSILDESNDTTLSASTEEGEGSIDRSFDNASPIPENNDDSHCLDSSYEDIIPLYQNNKSENIKRFQSALEEANDMIRKLHCDLKKAKGDDADADLPDEAPVVKVGDDVLLLPTITEPFPPVFSPPRSLPPIKGSPSNNNEEDETTVNVRMLDGENYVTEWSELRPALPPPPDHGLRSPIVEAVLQQWTADASLHESLLSWMDDVLTAGKNNNNNADDDPIAAIPPLTLSNLDHQVRDGFVMHVLPLLLRRPDIRVDVQTRAHRRTSYDLAVSIDPLTSHPAIDARRHLDTLASRSGDMGGGADSTTHSTTTALMSNHTAASSTASRSSRVFFPEDNQASEFHHSSRLSYDEMADGSVGPGEHQTGIIRSALGGALGWLRKPGTGPDTPHGTDNTTMQTITETPGASGGVDAAATAPGSVRLGGSAVGEDGVAGFNEGEDASQQQPYHRVVAAPPGRLGVTFVEYRGHAMVSDVNDEDSPLVGWIFPSDILIAIDELPVSGMRVRDIIKVLKDRKDRQRALRVISSHDMTELTLPNTSTANSDHTT